MRWPSYPSKSPKGRIDAIYTHLGYSEVKSAKSCLKICVCWHASRKQVAGQQIKCVSIGIKGRYIQMHVNHTGSVHTLNCTGIVGRRHT